MKTPSLRIALAAIAAISIAGCAAPAHRQVWIDAERNIRVHRAKSVHFFPEGTVTVTKKTLVGGKQDGVDVIEIDNGTLQIVICPTRGMGILEVRRGDMRLGWNSPVQEVVHPRHIDLESRGGLGWLEGFNEWMCRCGLAFAGHPGEDEFTTNTGDTAKMDLTLHGKIANLPASKVEVIVEREPPHRVRVRGVVHERMFYGPKLELAAEVSTLPGADTFVIHDTVTNRGAFDQEFQIIYHANFGRPLLEAGARLVAAVQSVAPMNDHAAKAVKDYATYAGPTRGFVEEVYLMKPYADVHGMTAAVLHNAKADRGVSMQWPVKQLPYLTQWKNTAAETDGYVTGIEPATGYPYNRSVERKAGRVPTLAPGESRHFEVWVSVLPDAPAVAKAVKHAHTIRAERRTQIHTQPPKSD